MMQGTLPPVGTVSDTKMRLSDAGGGKREGVLKWT